MKSVILGALLTLSTSAWAGEMPYPRAQHTRNVGIGLTAPGVLFAGPGLALMVSGAFTTCENCGTSAAYQLVFGGMLAGLGVPFLATGVPMWAMGQGRIKKNRLEVGLLPTPKGLTVVARF